MEIKTYKELKEYIRMFKTQNCDLLIIMSKGGLGKTTLLKEIMKEDYIYINTHSTPLRTFKLLYEKRDMPVLFDDIDSILTNKIFVSLLKALADTSPIKELHYNTTSSLIGNVPSKFTTTSNVCLLLNEFDIRNKTLKPLLDRGFLVEFLPDRKEILNKIKEIKKSQNIVENEKWVYEFIRENIEKINNLSLRTYIKGLQLYAYNPKNWKEKFMQEVGFDEKIIDYLKLKEKYKTQKERIDKFKWSRATFFRVRSEFGNNQ